MAHASSHVLNELRLQGEFSDAVIRVQNEDFRIHRIIVSGCSKYFMSLFTHWSHPVDQVYTVDRVSPDIMRLIIEFAYIGSADVNQQNVKELYMACDFFNVIGLMDACCRFMGEHLSKDNCIDIWQFSETYRCLTLSRNAFLLIEQHFTEVCTSSDFLQLPLQQLLKLIEADQLLVKDERTVFEAILRWIDHSPEERTTYISQILPKVRLALTTLSYFMTNVKNNQMVMCDTECQDTVKTAETLLNGGIVSSRGTYHPLARPRLPANILLAIGGWIKNSVATNAIEAYNICTDCWVNITNTEEAPHAHQGTVFLNGSVYCVGGQEGAEFLSSVRRFDLATHTWHQVSPMKTRRCFVSVTALNGHIYAIGGYDKQSRLSTAERYDPETNQWMEIASMLEHRSHASCTAFQGKVYICGGFNGDDILSSAEYYRPETNQWTLMAPMSTNRKGLGVVAFEEHIYAVGGVNGTSHLKSAEAYDLRTNSWHTVPPMLSPRSNFGIGLVDGCLFVVGGLNGFTYISNVEVYDLNTSEWFEATSMGISRCSASCCVVSGLTNMADYTAPRDSSLDHTHRDLPIGTLLAIGGGSTGHGVTNAVEAYDARTDLWVNLTNNEEAPRAYHGAVFLNGSAYCVGGYDDVEVFSSVRRFDLATCTWHQVAPMHRRRCYVSVTALNGRIYAIGGYDGRRRLNTAECYDPETNQWTKISSMHVNRSDAGCTTFQGKVYICGGFNGYNSLSSAEYYSPETNRWTMICPMSSRRTALSVAAVEDHIYSVGGSNGTSLLKSAEAYNPLTNSWHTVPPMQSPRCNFGIEAMDGHLFVIGGFNGLTDISNVEFYDVNTDEWSEASNMKLSRSALSCCVVSGLTNMADYTAPRDSSLNHAHRDLPIGTLLAIGGGSTGHGVTNAVEAYDARTDLWVNLTNNEEAPRAYHGAVFLNGSAYCVGGYDDVEVFSSVRRFDLATCTWHQVAPMHRRRCYVSVTALNGRIYAIGGYDGRRRLNTAECYDPETNQWTKISSMHVNRSDAGCTTFQGKVYICGGFNGYNSLSSAEYYSPETNRWTMICPMSSWRTALSVAAVEDHIYSVGGSNGTSLLKSAEAYNPLTNSWHTVPPMQSPRCNFGIEAVDGHLFVIGGFNGLTDISNVEFYDVNTGEWSEASNMKLSRSALSCCVVSGPTTITDCDVLL